MSLISLPAPIGTRNQENLLKLLISIVYRDLLESIESRKPLRLSRCFMVEGVSHDVSHIKSMASTVGIIVIRLSENRVQLKSR
jgi:hypothetical protein